MRLFLMRHCAAEPGERMDAKRPLTDEGLHQAKLMKRFRKQAGIKWDVIFSSDFERAVTTAQIVRNKKAPWYMLKELRPLGTAEEAFAAIARSKIADDPLAHGGPSKEITDNTRILVVTHEPLIEKMAAAVCFGFSPDINNFSHGSMLRVDTHRVADKHPLHWMVRPSLFESIEEGEVIEAAVDLSENLRKTSKAAVVDPLIAKMTRWVAARFRNQARRYKTAGVLVKNAHNDVYHRITYDAYIAGAAMVNAQIGKMSEADVAHGIWPFSVSMPNIREAKKQPLLPVAIATALSTYERTGADLERELDETSAARIAGMVAMDSTQDEIAKVIASWANDRAEMIAATEVSSALHAGMADAASVIGQQQGVEVEKAWNVEDDPCEICLGNVDDGWVLEDINFASGDDGPPAHPNCRCSLSYRNSGGE